MSERDLPFRVVPAGLGGPLAAAGARARTPAGTAPRSASSTAWQSGSSRRTASPHLHELPALEGRKETFY